MRVSRFLPVLVAGAVFTATAAPASAATPGVGTTIGSLEVLSLDIGDPANVDGLGALLELDLLTDFAAANTDPDVDDAGAAAALKALVVDALVLPEPVELGLLNVESDGDEKTASNNGFDVAGELPDQISSLLGGTVLPASLLASLTEPGAMSSTAGELAAIDILGGVAGIETTQLGIAANSLTEQADGARRLVIDKVTVLELGDLLEGLGIPLDQLPLGMVLDLLDGLGLTEQVSAALTGLGLPATGLDGFGILDLLQDVGTLEDLAITDAPAICDAGNETLSEIAGGILGAAGSTAVLDTCEAIVAELALVPIDIDALLGLALDSIVGTLADTALVELSALDVSMITKANDSLETSDADVTATLGGLSIAGVPVPEIDLTELAAQVNGAVETLLTTIDPILGGLVSLDVALLEDNHNVEEKGEAIVSTADFTGLRLDLTSALTQQILDQVIAGLPAVDAVDLPLGELPIGGLVGGDLLGTVTDLLDVEGLDAVSALSDGLSLRVASLGQQSTFTEVLNNTATPTPAAPQLPQTGSNDALMLALAAIAAGGALGIRRMVRIEE